MRSNRPRRRQAAASALGRWMGRTSRSTGQSAGTRHTPNATCASLPHAITRDARSAASISTASAPAHAATTTWTPGRAACCAARSAPTCTGSTA
eukprot:11162099-Lingulodinium_polyedra.AAC.1